MIEGRERTIDVDDEMVEAVQEWLDVCNEDFGDHFGEQRLEITDWCPVDRLADHPYLPQLRKQTGTSDRLTMRDHYLGQKDLKYGEGIEVYAENNDQGILYAAGAIKEYNWLYDFKTVRIEIFQPRRQHHDIWETDVATIMRKANELKKAFYVALSPNPPFGPHPKACQFCKAKATCHALAEKIDTDAALMFDDLTQNFPEDTNALPIEALVESWRTRKLYMIRLNGIAKELMQRLRSGSETPGLKVVEGVSKRRYRSSAYADFVMEMLGVPAEARYTKKFASVKAIEKILTPEQRKIFADAWIKPPGKPTIVEETDRRKAITLDHSDAFEDLEEFADDESDAVEED